MSKPTKPSDDEFDSAEIFSDPDLDPESFVEAMEDNRRARSGWKRVEELSDAKWLRAQLADWEDWDQD
jgi:hypothetical protein